MATRTRTEQYPATSAIAEIQAMEEAEWEVRQIVTYDTPFGVYFIVVFV